MRFVVDHVFHGTDVDRFAEVYFSEEFNEAVAPITGMKERRLVEERRDPDGKLHRRVRLAPDVSLPGPLQKLVGKEAITYDEVAVYDPAAREARYRIEHKAGDRLEVKGVVRFLPVEGGVRRVIEGDVDVRVFGVGGLVERFIESEVKKGYEKIAAFLQRWLDEHPRA